MYIGIVAEWNPFHEGHAFLLRTLRQSYGDVPVAAVQSGAFVQRGEPAIFDKWSRAAWSVESGVDLVVELPAVCALQSADRFAAAGAQLAADLGCSHLAFAAESLPAEALMEMAAWSLSPHFSAELRQALDAGIPYNRAVNEAMALRFPSEKEALSLPNNLLGIQYARTIAERHLPLSIITIRRDSSLSPASATAIRQKIKDGAPPPWIPETEKASLSALLSEGRVTDYDRYDDACLLCAKTLTKDELRRSQLFSEGLENRWYSARDAASYGDMLSQVKSKRYLLSRLRRTGASLLLGGGHFPSPMSRPGQAPYARLLAMRRSKSDLLRQAVIPVVTRFARGEKDMPQFSLYFEMEKQASNMQSFCFQSADARTGGMDYLHSPVILP